MDNIDLEDYSIAFDSYNTIVKYHYTKPSKAGVMKEYVELVGYYVKGMKGLLQALDAIMCHKIANGGMSLSLFTNVSKLQDGIIFQQGQIEKLVKDSYDYYTSEEAKQA